ncbi:hypothetical protein F5887DRAFT_952849 [Amanita rubescens]|nr:hypothetical protein F5887DRAFT_952849 [Amanita rubescens]
MSPANLQGLNIVLPTSPEGDARDLIGHPYPDLAAQLDLWTNLAFDSDEGPAVTKVDEEALVRKSADDDDDTSSIVGSHTPDNNSHVNIQPPLDISSLLAGIGIDPFSAPQQSAAFSPSLAQLLALHAVQFSSPSDAAPASAQPQKTKPVEKSPHASGADEASPPAKRPRNRRASEMLAADGTVTSEQVASVAAEDKRRRNTAASARFRLKKKEREAALEGKAKELEVRVSELERECETLRRENGWLKGLVIGVTGAAQAPVVSAPQFGTTSKRIREEVDE